MIRQITPMSSLILERNTSGLLVPPAVRGRDHRAQNFMCGDERLRSDYALPRGRAPSVTATGYAMRALTAHSGQLCVRDVSGMYAILSAPEPCRRSKRRPTLLSAATRRSGMALHEEA